MGGQRRTNRSRLFLSVAAVAATVSLSLVLPRWLLPTVGTSSSRLQTNSTAKTISAFTGNRTANQPLQSEPMHPSKTKKKTNLYVWVHVPKTGGSSLYKTFFAAMQKAGKKIYPPQKGTHDYNAPGCADEPIFGGTHCASSELEDCLTRIRPNLHRKFVTTMRDPVERVVSEYFWWSKKRPNRFWTQAMNEKADDMYEWVVDGSNLAHNRQAQYLLFDRPFVPKCHLALSKEGDMTDWVEARFGSPQRMNQLQLDDSDLDRYDFIIVLEELERSKERFKEKFGVDAMAADQRKSVLHKSNKTIVSEKILNAIQERNKLDIQLYQLAKARLHG